MIVSFLKQRLREIPELLVVLAIFALLVFLGVIFASGWDALFRHAP